MKSASTKKAKWWQKILLAVCSPLIVLLLAEGIFRVFGINTDLARNKNFDIAVPVWLLADSNWVRNEYDRLNQPKGVKAVDVAWFANFVEARYIQYKLKPRIDVQAINPFNDIEVRKNITFRITSNKAGFRTREFTRKKRGTFRIVTLGDSSTFGWGVDPEYTWQYLLEKRLLPRFGAVEVFNLGLSGFTTRHGLGVLRHYASNLEPDLLILGFGANDGRYVLQPADVVLAVDDTFLGTLRWTLLKFKTVQWIRSWIFSVYDPFKNIVPPAGQPRRSRIPSVPLDEYRRNLLTLIAEGKKQGATTVLLSLCAPDDYARAMREIAKSENLPYVDGKDVFLSSVERIKAGSLYPQEASYERSVYGDEAMAKNQWLYVTSDGCHPHRTGTNLIADALADAVEKAVRGLGLPK
jgi:lysophospholipase L1-like esterase